MIIYSPSNNCNSLTAHIPHSNHSSQRKHLQRINDSLTDQIRLLKNQIRRHRMEYEEKLSEMQKELELKNCIIERREENLDRIKKFSEEIEHEDQTTKHSSDIEVASIHIYSIVYVVLQENPKYSITFHYRWHERTAH